MRARLLSACIGSLAGFAIGALLWLLDLYATEGVDHLFGLMVGLALGCGIMAFLFPVSSSGFLAAGLRGIFGYGVALPDPPERKGSGHD